MGEAHVSGLGLQPLVGGCRQIREHLSRGCPATERRFIANGLPGTGRNDAADEEKITASLTQLLYQFLIFLSLFSHNPFREQAFLLLGQLSPGNQAYNVARFRLVEVLFV